ncbi:DUF1223 domain-containing protein [Lewinellaceae bacterium SD302]|nr:DUF1223 domain-containing protein [Lewinellaceae bacterium SD302]
MKYSSILITTLLCLGLYAFTCPAEPGKAQPVTRTDDGTSFALLELFTSQGCSSCPPADEQLARFAERTKAGEAIYALSYHVDYWNYLGWEDPFSDARFSARQRNYAEQLRSRVYTPQLVVNGQTEMIGSRKGETETAVRSALESRQPYSLSFTYILEGDAIEINYQLTGDELPQSAYLVAVAVQPDASRSVKRGENRGRELRHVNVVRAFQQQPIEDLQGSIELTPPTGLENYELVLFVQEGEAGEVLAAAKG